MKNKESILIWAKRVKLRITVLKLLKKGSGLHENSAKFTEKCKIYQRSVQI